MTGKRQKPTFICPFCSQESEPWKVMCCDQLAKDTKEKLAALKEFQKKTYKDAVFG